MNPRWLIKMSRWARNPPSPRQVAFVLGIVAVCVAFGAYEYMFGWPEFLTVNGRAKP
ncbi:hypothetical protein [Neogemmobacter tilapiae]|jgi:hypothetical protein|uniref:Uncharacterized protein n=1 Tax=Neogemmobacter tilapiae TaxID=875041 RepID=A0A918TFS1_9RHOB|nr:hypothetical protein [Gemmobacter tilapiae]GHC44180.1 hypothetical protein GCM10007315_01670 [Gemmobacter tilapiae]